MVYLLIFFAIFLVIGPVLWLRPSKGEQALAALRQAAIQTGAQIQPMNIREDAVYSGILQRNPHLGDHKWIRYQWMAGPNEKGPALKDTWIQRKDPEEGLVWEPRSVHTEEDALVAAVLESWRTNQDVRFLALELGPRNVCLVWNEKGSPQEVAAFGESIKQLLKVN
ncbi:MAG: hypothetical protein MI867_13025 [Pseudomonadales bacterium]|nr:hypothetical protein [Pseudomonadales bacterium]